MSDDLTEYFRGHPEVERRIHDSRRAMEQALVRVVEPVLTHHGFNGRCPDYRRVRGDWLDIVNFQFHDHRPVFIINVGVAPKNGLTTRRGEFIEPDDVNIGYELPKQARFHPGPTEATWFDYGKAVAEEDFQFVGWWVVPYIQAAQVWFERGYAAMKHLPREFWAKSGTDVVVRRKFSLLRSLWRLLATGTWRRCYKVVDDDA